MINLYTNREKLPKNIKWIIDIDPYFDGKINATMLGEKDRRLMKEIENVAILDDRFGTCQSDEGVFPLTYISTGLKTLLVIRYLKQKGIPNMGVDISECGPDVIDYIFEEVTDGSLSLLLTHRDILDLKDREINLNNKIVVKTIRDLCLELLDT